ncbi:hypothetical protein [Nocardia sp. NRRL S-836]|uniref:hypothetical protein n=1 Tax=Nocardia sp. NRRL S-836 TaxID=1519492 RepID=UPI0012F79B8E|nr:hypothetical protein [Nocardia sp. NRRL S-836]
MINWAAGTSVLLAGLDAVDQAPKNVTERTLLTFHREIATVIPAVELTAVMVIGMRRNHSMRSLRLTRTCQCTAPRHPGGGGTFEPKGEVSQLRT